MAFTSFSPSSLTVGGLGFKGKIEKTLHYRIQRQRTESEGSSSFSSHTREAPGCLDDLQAAHDRNLSKYRLQSMPDFWIPNILGYNLESNCHAFATMFAFIHNEFFAPSNILNLPEFFESQTFNFQSLQSAIHPRNCPRILCPNSRSV